MVSEYRFRPGAVPVVVLLQNLEGRNRENPTLLREGILASLQSKNVVFNSMSFGSGADIPELFNLSLYLGDGDVRILGVEADLADGTSDGKHSFTGYNTITGAAVSTVGATNSQALQVSFDGSNTGASGMVASGKSVLFSTSGPAEIGPSTFGYRATSVPFAERKVDMTGATVHSSFSTAITLPSPLNFYGTNYAQIWLDDDGTVRFTSGSAPDFTNVDLSRTTFQTRPNFPFIAALWDNLFPDSDTGRILKKVGNFDGVGGNDLAIEWRDFRYAFADTDVNDSISFQVVFYASGEIGVNYIDLEDSGILQISGQWEPGISGGVSATVGLWSGNADNITLPPGQFVPGPHSVFGSINDAEAQHSESNDRYVRLAWDTGGAAWDLGVLDGFGNIGDPQTARDSLRDAFLDSLGNQINRQAAAGKVFQNYEPLVSVNVGGPTIGGYMADVGFGATYSPLAAPLNHQVLLDHNDFRFHAFPDDAPADILRTGGGSSGGSETWSFDANSLLGGVADGSYVVELFFAELANSSVTANLRSIDVTIEGRQMLNNYRMGSDRAASGTINTLTGAVENNLLGGVFSAGNEFRGTVKGFQVDVTDGNGLQVTVGGTGWFVNAMRILKADPPPTITDVKVSKTGAWSIPFSQRLSQNGRSEQMRPIPNEAGANKLEITFSEPVVNALGNPIDGNELRLKRTIRRPDGTFVTEDLDDIGANDWNFVYTPASRTGTWTFTNALPDGKYAIFLDDSIRDAAGNQLDAEWQGINYDDNGTPDTYSDDPVHSFEHNVTRGIGDGTAATEGGAFRFHFALLAGDTDGDGIISQTNFLPVLKYRGADFNDDEIVNNQDLLVWQANFGMNANGDADGDGDSDGLDFSKWLQNFSNESAWHFGAGPVSPVTTTGLPPQVLNVIVSGSASTHAPFSFDTVDGSGMQLATVPVGLADTISIVFSENVNVSATSLILVGMTTANVPELAEFSYDPLTSTATWRFEGWTLADNYLLYLSDSVTDVEGNFLDGEWTNPASRTTSNAAVSEFPSGDGLSGGAFVFTMTLLPGDANLDGVVNYDDYMIWDTYSAQDGGFQEGDFAGDGIVGAEDAAIWYQMYSAGFNFQNPFLAADVDEDGDVDDDDLQILSDNYGMTGATRADGDLNGNGTIDSADLDIAFAQFGLWFASVA